MARHFIIQVGIKTSWFESRHFASCYFSNAIAFLLWFSGACFYFWKFFFSIYLQLMSFFSFSFSFWSSLQSEWLEICHICIGKTIERIISHLWWVLLRDVLLRHHISYGMYYILRLNGLSTLFHLINYKLVYCSQSRKFICSDIVRHWCCREAACARGIN